MPEIKESVKVTEAAGEHQLEAVFILEGISKNGNLWTREVLERNVDKFRGVPIYIDHPTLSESLDRPERSLRDLAGVVVDASYGMWPTETGQGMGVGGRVKLSSNADWLMNLFREGMAGDMSIFALAEAHSEDDMVIIDEIESVVSVDLVTKASAGGRLVRTLSESDRVDLSRILFTDEILGQAIEVSSSGSIEILESDRFRPSVEVQEEELPAEEPLAEEPPAEELPTEDPLEEEISAEAEVGEVPAEEVIEELIEDQPEEEGVQRESFQLTEEAEAKLRVVFQSLVDSAMQSVREMFRSSPAEECEEELGEENQSEDTGDLESNMEEAVPEVKEIDFEEADLLADLKLSVEEVIQDSALSELSRDRVRQDLVRSRFTERFLEEFGGGVGRDEVISKAIQEASSRIEGEVRYLEEVSPAVVRDNGPRFKQVRRDPDIDGVLESYGLVKN